MRKKSTCRCKHYPKIKSRCKQANNNQLASYHHLYDFIQANNNRLANYIDKVRQLQTENRRMTKQIQVKYEYYYKYKADTGHIQIPKNVKRVYLLKMSTSILLRSNMNKGTNCIKYEYILKMSSSQVKFPSIDVKKMIIHFWKFYCCFFCSDATTTLRQQS